MWCTGAVVHTAAVVYTSVVVYMDVVVHTAFVVYAGTVVERREAPDGGARSPARACAPRKGGRQGRPPQAPRFNVYRCLFVYLNHVLTSGSGAIASTTT